MKLPECVFLHAKSGKKTIGHTTTCTRAVNHKWKLKLIFLNSGLVCKVSAGNENAFQTTSYLSALSSREDLLLPLVLGLRRWAQVCFRLTSSPLAHISQATGKRAQYAYLFNMPCSCLWLRSVRLTVQRKVGCHRTSSPSWLFTSYSSAKSPSCLPTWNKRCVFLFTLRLK